MYIQKKTVVIVPKSFQGNTTESYIYLFIVYFKHAECHLQKKGQYPLLHYLGLQVDSVI